MMTDKNFIQFMEILLDKEERLIDAIDGLKGEIKSLHVDLRPELSRSDMMQRKKAEQKILEEATAKAVKKHQMSDSNSSP
jgi:hypothetical protein